MSTPSSSPTGACEPCRLAWASSSSSSSTWAGREVGAEAPDGALAARPAYQSTDCRLALADTGSCSAGGLGGGLRARGTSLM
jgi:hypothetical protein